VRPTTLYACRSSFVRRQSVILLRDDGPPASCVHENRLSNFSEKRGVDGRIG
jgi:hypothetical protein